MQSCIYNEYPLLLEPHNLELVCIFFSINQNYVLEIKNMSNNYTNQQTTKNSSLTFI